MQASTHTAATAAALRAYGSDEDIVAAMQARWEAECAEVRAREADILAVQKGLWATCRSMHMAENVDRTFGMQDLMPAIMHLAALADGDYCDLGEAVFNLINNRFRETAKNINTGEDRHVG